MCTSDSFSFEIFFTIPAFPTLKGRTLSKDDRTSQKCSRNEKRKKEKWKQNNGLAQPWKVKKEEGFFTFIEQFYYLTWFFTLALLKFFPVILTQQRQTQCVWKCPRILIICISNCPCGLYTYHMACCQGIQLQHKMFSSSKLVSLFTSFLCFNLTSVVSLEDVSLASKKP